MGKIQIFKNPDFGEIRVSGSAAKPLFCLADVCKALAIGNPSQVKTRLDEQGVELIDLQALNINEGVIISQLGNTSTNFINEPNLYRCIFMSRKSGKEVA